MADTYRTPGVYIEEVPHLPPSIASVDTAVPAFIGYTQFAKKKVDNDLLHVPQQIESMLEYQQYFGYAQPEPGITVTIDETQTPIAVTATVDENARSKFLMYYSLESFFLNGGSLCYIVSVGNYTDGIINLTDLGEKPDGTGGLDVIKQVTGITLIVFPDAINLTGADAAANYYYLHELAMLQCSTLKNRFTVMDMFRTPGSTNWKDDKKLLRGDGTDANPAKLTGNTDTLKYGAVYFPRIKTNIQFSITDPNTGLDKETLVNISLNGASMTLDKLKTTNNKYYNLAKDAYKNNLEMLLPVSSAMVGIYALVDNARGVWKAPANLSILGAIDLEEKITDLDQDDLNVDTNNGLSINAIRSFPRGAAIVWGARTLAGNDNEWRYISVRRLFIMLEQSIRNATEQFVFEPNDENTWVRVKSMIEIYLTEQWKAGALMGTSTKQAFYVHIGLGQTMSEVDVWEGRMIIEIGVAPVRPAEFIILRFIQKMLDES